MSDGPIDWRGLSPRSREILAWVAAPVAKGFTHAEAATILERSRDMLQSRWEHLEVPAGRFLESWVSARVKELRREIIKQQAPKEPA